MIETIASRLSHQIILLQVADKEDEEIIAFGLFHIISVFQQTIILAFIAYVLKLYEIAAFTIAFTSLKRYIGGYHAHKHWLCITYYTAFSSISCLILKCMPIKINTISLLSVIAALVFIVFMKAPVTHPNNRKSKGQLNRLRVKSIQTCLLQAVVILMGHTLLPEYRTYFTSMALGSLTSALTLLLPVPAK